MNAPTVGRAVTHPSPAFLNLFVNTAGKALEKYR